MNPELWRLKEKIEKGELTQEEREKIDDFNVLESFNDAIAGLASDFLELNNALVDYVLELRRAAKRSYRAAGYPLGRDEEAMWQWFLGELEMVKPPRPA